MLFRLVLTIALLYGCGAYEDSLLAQQAHTLQSDLKFEELHGYKSYQRFMQMRRKLEGGGRIFNVRWAADGSRVLYQQGKQDLQLQLPAGLIGSAAKQIETQQLPKPESRHRSPVARAEQRTHEPSVDGKWVAIYDNFNVMLKPIGSNQKGTRLITTDGTERRRFGTGCWVYGEELDQDEAMWWSDDGQKLAFYEIDETGMRDYPLTFDNVKRYTRIEATRYPKAGSRNPRVGLWVYDLQTQQTKKLDIAGPADQYLFNIRFVPESHLLLVYRATRRQDTLDVLAVDVDSGKVKSVVSETQETWQHNQPVMRFLEDGKRFVWETERTGWKQFELRDVEGRLINGLSDNDGYPVQQGVYLDEEAKWFYYSAFSDANPYNAQLHRCRLDGTDCRRITTSPLNHSDFEISPDHQYVVTRRQQLDSPVSTVVYDMSGVEIAVLAQGSTDVAAEVGLSPPELFSFTANDGATEIYGTLHKPSNFSPEKTYPLLVDVYGGPQSTGIVNNYRPANPICELGFLVAKIGNRGTVGRGKAFESANYLKLGIPDLDDQADAVRFLAKRPYVDGNRVGIFGHSYGGYLSALAMVRYPDVFHVAVAGAPVTDWCNYDSIYTERYMRLPKENPEGYKAGSCVELADQLKGKLLLVHGLIDDNVHPANTWQLVKALQDADKRFDLMVYPEFKHGIGSTYDAVRWEYFVRHLKPKP